MSFFKSLLSEKSQEGFYKMLTKQCEMTVEAIDELCEYVENPSKSTQLKITHLEREADNIRRELICMLEAAFITPFEREDIFSLSKAIDDLLDYSKSTVDEIEIFGLDTNKDLKDMVYIIRDAVLCILKTVRVMDNPKNKCQDDIIKAKKYENAMENLYRYALVRLVENEDIRYILKMREVYRHLSNLADKIDIAADILGNIMLKRS
ncbi:MAG TPA: DUF47 family protein [Clostridia bacterium]|nr:DUF47 family protein [Clostridia bacterium]